MHPRSPEGGADRPPSRTQAVLDPPPSAGPPVRQATASPDPLRTPSRSACTPSKACVAGFARAQ
ncbi:hypothetical protein CERSUDRAFT_96366 [Gelatoporia subvermispora B]|uniref:Uncharacterized protein n=1 Tax=Ceriporiopsis subvermispora (strain B) TaxID=914234 RepID=M2RBH4_CERS8|nr:hypothetical protein CERSUDRAFT_96366 [Gelatoporia subvermispora B]